MPAPGTTFIWDDQSQINQVQSGIAVSIDRPVYMAVFTADKGPEGYIRNVNADDFKAYYGNNIDFSRHGQALLTAAQVVDQGGLLFAKRVVGEGAKLANIGVVAKVHKANVQKTDENGNPVFVNTTTGEETTNSVGATPLMIQRAEITYELKSVDMETNNPSNIAEAFYSDTQDMENGLGNDGAYPLFVITDIGRGVSNKRIRIYTNDASKKPVNYYSYIFKVLEGTSDNTLDEEESFVVTMNPETMREFGEVNNYALNTVINNQSKQIRARVFPEAWDAFCENVAYISNNDKADIPLCDLLFGDNRYGKPLANLKITDASVKFDDATGISLMNGSYGKFGTTPMTAGGSSSYYYAQVDQAFNGTYDDIYDVDNNRIDVIFDCNYPDFIKRDIEALVNFRQDCFFFEDMGTEVSTYLKVKNYIENLPDKARTKFVGIYSNFWDIFDPYSGKQITVTSTYNMAVKFVRHYLNGVARPFCGQAYEIIFDEVIPGTINFTPKITPTDNQKQFFDDNRVNYATYYDGILTMDSEYTAQDAYTQLSWINNVLMVENVIRDVRKRCPINRYKFLDGDDLVQYKADVEAVLAKHSSKFKTITIQYMKDDNYDHNKIFYATIAVTFRDFVQSEIFKIETLLTAASTSTTATTTA